MPAAVEAFVPLNGSAGNSAPVGGKRKLKLVTRKQARKALKKLGMKMRGGAPTDAVVADAETGTPVATTPAAQAGGKRKTAKRSASRRASKLFGL